MIFSMPGNFFYLTTESQFWIKISHDENAILSLLIWCTQLRSRSTTISDCRSCESSIDILVAETQYSLPGGIN